MRKASAFSRFTKLVSSLAGTPQAFILAAGIIVVWAVFGPAFGFSDTWQLVINTGTTIVTFVMVFVIQNTQNRDSTAMHLKLDELIRATSEADKSLLDLEELNQEDLERIREQYEKLAEDARTALRARYQRPRNEGVQPA